MKLSKLHKFNKDIFKLDKTSRKFEAKNRYSKNLMMGLFYGHKILFIGRNPGYPKIVNELTNQFHTNDLSYELVQELYEKQFRSWAISKYILNICANVRLYFYISCSFTNLVKFSTINNSSHSLREKVIFSKILEKQIALVQPTLIVSMSMVTADILSMIDLHGARLISINHPGYHNYSQRQCKIDSEKIKDMLK